MSPTQQPERDADSYVKGVVVANLLRSLRAVVSENRIATRSHTLSPATRAHLESPPIASVWVPSAQRKELLHWAHRELLDNSDEALLELGAANYERSFSSVYRMFVRFVSPSFTLSRIQTSWTALAKNLGTVRIAGQGSTWAEIAHQGYRGNDRLCWIYALGVYTGIARVIRLKRPTARIVSGGGDSEDATIRIDWED